MHHVPLALVALGCVGVDSALLTLFRPQTSGEVEERVEVMVRHWVPLLARILDPNVSVNARH